MKDKNLSIPINQEEIATYLKDIRKIKVMTPDREKQLAQRMLSDDLTLTEKRQIEQELLTGNLRFVITVAKQYQNQGLELCDLIAEGNLGLLKAVENFDWSKQLRFISYAVWWVRQSILHSLNENARTIRLPVNVVQELQKAKKELEKSGVEFLSNPDALAPDSGFHTKDILKDKLKGILEVLDDREKIIIEDYYGLSGNTRTLEDIGNDFQLTKERVRQIKEKALRKLRNESSELFDYL